MDYEGVSPSGDVPIVGALDFKLYGIHSSGSYSRAGICRPLQSAEPEERIEQSRLTMKSIQFVERIHQLTIAPNECIGKALSQEAFSLAPRVNFAHG